MTAPNSVEMPADKRTCRMTVNLSPKEYAAIERAAKEQRIEPAVRARNIMLDFIEGKLVPASAEKPA